MPDLIRKDASATTGGELTTDAQTLTGDKTFTGDINPGGTTEVNDLAASGNISGASYTGLPVADNNTQGIVQFSAQGDVNSVGYYVQGYDHAGAAFNNQNEKYTFTVPLSDTSGEAVYMFSLNFSYNYSNSNGTQMTSAAVMRIKETNTGGVTLWNREQIQYVLYPPTDPIHFQNAAGFIKPAPGITQLYISLGEKNVGGGAYSATRGRYSVSVQRVPF